MRAFRLGPEGAGPIIAWLERCRELRFPLRAILIDAYQAGVYGGTGTTADWTVARDLAAIAGMPPMVLAGGLTPGNVADAIRAARPAAVDTASGVEESPGRKDPALVRAYVRAALSAWATLPL